MIFFLQTTQRLPKLTELIPPQSTFIDRVPHVNKEELKQTIGQFFKFYGIEYDMSLHLISTIIGRWQVRELLAQQTNFGLEQERFASIYN